MKNDPILVITIHLFLLVLLSGCGSVISKELRSKVNPNLRLETVRKDPEGFRGEKVLFGGTILKVLVKKDHILLEILEKPLGSRDRPKYETDTSGGRFLVFIDGYKDPAIYHRGRMITVFGEVLGSRTRKMGELDYVYLLIRSEEYYLWKEGEAAGPRFHFGFGIYRHF